MYTLWTAICKDSTPCPCKYPNKVADLLELNLFPAVRVRQLKRGPLLLSWLTDQKASTDSSSIFHVSARFLPHRPISTHLSDVPSPCCRCWETEWCRAFLYGRHTSWFLPSSVESPVTVNPSQRQPGGVNWRLVSCRMLFFFLNLHADPLASYLTLLCVTRAELASSLGPNKRENR